MRQRSSSANLPRKAEHFQTQPNLAPEMDPAHLSRQQVTRDMVKLKIPAPALPLILTQVPI